MYQVLQISILVGTASLVVMLTASYAQSMYNIPGFNLKPGDSFTVKINITDPEEFSLGKVEDLGGQQDISNVFLQYIKNEGLINVTDYDERIKFIGNGSLGQAWFRFDNVKLNDTGTYSVLYKRKNSADLFSATFQVNVTKDAQKANPNIKASWQQLLKIPDVNVFSGQEFEVKLNFTDKNDLPAKVCFVKLKNAPRREIETFFLHYHKVVGSMSGDVRDSRIYFIGNLSFGHVWFRFLDVHVNDSGTYGVLWKTHQNTDIIESVFVVNVTQAPVSETNPNAGSKGESIYPRERNFEESTTSTEVVNKARESARSTASTFRDTSILVLLLIVITNTFIKV